MEQKQVKIWAHRGASGYAPENTMEAFQMAVDMGADGIELDVQMTADRQIVVAHDEWLHRVSNGTGKISEYTLEQLKILNFNKTHPEYEDARIPTLRQVLEFIEPTSLTLNIELKTGVNFYEGIEAMVLSLVKEFHMEERVVYSSFNHHSVMRIQELDSSAHLGFLYCDGPLDMVQYALKYNVEALHPAIYNMQYPGFVDECKENNIKIHVWTVNSKEDMKRMIIDGADAIITNYPDVACEVVSKIACKLL